MTLIRAIKIFGFNAKKALVLLVPLALALTAQAALAQNYDLSSFSNNQALQSLGARGGYGNSSAAYAPPPPTSITNQQLTGPMGNLALNPTYLGGLTQIYGIHNGYAGLPTYQVFNPGGGLSPAPLPIIVPVAGPAPVNTIDPNGGNSPPPVNTIDPNGGNSPPPVNTISPNGGNPPSAPISLEPPSQSAPPAATTYLPPNGGSGGSGMELANGDSGFGG